jgi:hypothetical protein
MSPAGLATLLSVVVGAVAAACALQRRCQTEPGATTQRPTGPIPTGIAFSCSLTVVRPSARGNAVRGHVRQAVRALTIHARLPLTMLLADRDVRRGVRLRGSIRANTVLEARCTNPRINRVGNWHLRHALFMPAVACCREPHLRGFYENLLASGKRKKIALIAVARKMHEFEERIHKSKTTGLLNRLLACGSVE